MNKNNSYTLTEEQLAAVPRLLAACLGAERALVDVGDHLTFDSEELVEDVDPALQDLWGAMEVFQDHVDRILAEQKARLIEAVS